MKKNKNNFVPGNLSFEDFEKSLQISEPKGLAIDELIKVSSDFEDTAKKKEAELKKAHRKRKVKLK